MKSKFNMKYDAKVKPASSTEIGTYITHNLKISLKKGYFSGSIPRGNFNNPHYQSIVASIDFRDGCHSSMTIVDTIGKHQDWREQAERWLQTIHDKQDEINHHMNERERLYEETRPLEKERTKHADELFKLVSLEKTDGEN